MALSVSGTRATLYEHKKYLTSLLLYSNNWFEKLNTTRILSFVHIPNLSKTPKLKTTFLALLILRKENILQNFELVIMICR